jgi:hypothetical protein
MNEKNEPNEDMNVRRVHGIIWREYPEPRELWRRTPKILRHFYVIMAIWLILYLIGWFPHWSWKNLDHAAPQTAQPAAAPTAP